MIVVQLFASALAFSLAFLSHVLPLGQLRFWFAATLYPQRHALAAAALATLAAAVFALLRRRGGGDDA